jgi:hypothetical protein
VLQPQYAATRGEFCAAAQRKSQNEFSKKIFLPGSLCINRIRSGNFAAG